MGIQSGAGEEFIQSIKKQKLHNNAIKMAYSGFTWAPLISMTAIKYQRHGYGEMRPFLPGERRSATREMERKMKGYKELRQELAESRRTIKQQEEMRKGAVEKTVRTSFYKSPDKQG